jgi:hypothetical protein
MDTAWRQNSPIYCMTATTVQEFIRKAGTINEESVTDKVYRQGLDFYWKGYYSKALAKFEEVQRLYPRHSEVEILIAECQRNVAVGNDKHYWPDYYGYIVTILIILSVSLFLFARCKSPLKKTINGDEITKNNSVN